VVETLLNHRSARAYRPDPLPEGTLETAIAAAQSAATSSNLQTWSVVAVEHPARKARLAAIAANQKHIVQAPLLLVRLAEVAVESRGLGTVHIGALRSDITAVARELALPPHVMPLFGLCVGQGRPRLAGEEEADAVILREVEADSLDAALAQPDRAVGRHPGRVQPEPRRVEALALVPTRADQRDVAAAEMRARLGQHRTLDRAVGRHRRDIHHRALPDRHVERDRIGGEPLGVDVARAVHVREGVHVPARPGRLAGPRGVRLDEAPLDLPAEMSCAHRGREVDQAPPQSRHWSRQGRSARSRCSASASRYTSARVSSAFRERNGISSRSASAIQARSCMVAASISASRAWIGRSPGQAGWPEAMRGAASPTPMASSARRDVLMVASSPDGRSPQGRCGRTVQAGGDNPLARLVVAT
jgi:hypothetical protein